MICSIRFNKTKYFIASVAICSILFFKPEYSMAANTGYKYDDRGSSARHGVRHNNTRKVNKHYNRHARHHYRPHHVRSYHRGYNRYRPYYRGHGSYFNFNYVYHDYPSYGRSYRAPARYYSEPIIVNKRPVYVIPKNINAPTKSSNNDLDRSQCRQIREYQTKVTIDGKEIDAYGDSCLMPDGSWKLGSPKLVQ